MVRTHRQAGSGDAQPHTITVDAGHAGRRLDKFLRSHFKGVPAGLLFRHIRQGRLRVNGAKTAQNYRLVAGDEITVPELRVEQQRGPHVPGAVLDAMRSAVLYEDAELLVVDKPAGIASHRGSDVPAGVIEAMRALRPDLPDLELIHRLDRDTSGTLALAKTSAELRRLQQLLRERDDGIERTYLAVVHGPFPGDTGVLDAALTRTETRVRVDPRGRPARTRVAVDRRLGTRATVVRAGLETGRKHQIRVHLADAGYPIVGDDRYGDPVADRHLGARPGDGLFLHAHRLVIPRPEAAAMTVTAPIPGRWNRIVSPEGTGPRRRTSDTGP